MSRRRCTGRQRRNDLTERPETVLRIRESRQGRPGGQTARARDADMSCYLIHRGAHSTQRQRACKRYFRLFFSLAWNKSRLLPGGQRRSLPENSRSEFSGRPRSGRVFHGTNPVCCLAVSGARCRENSRSEFSGRPRSGRVSHGANATGSESDRARLVHGRSVWLGRRRPRHTAKRSAGPAMGRSHGTNSFVPWEVGVAGPEATSAQSEAKCRAGYGALVWGGPNQCFPSSSSSCLPA